MSLPLRNFLAGLLLHAALFTGARAALPDAPSPAALRAAIAKSLPIIERSSAVALQERACFSCHHGAHPSLVLHAAWSRGFNINTHNLEDQLTRAYRGLIEDGPRFKEGWSIAGTADGPGTALWMLQFAGWKPDAVTAATTAFFLADTKHPDHWTPAMRRPPTVGSAFTTTYLVLRGLRGFHTAEQAPAATMRFANARRWLTATPARDTEDSVHRLRALHLMDADDEIFQKELRELLAMQQPDGGWPQRPDTASDGYATGTVLAALYDTRAVPPSAPVVQRALRYLLITQTAEGSWHVRKRTHDVQPFFDSSFPHGVDQFISISATSWATYALLHALPVTERKPYLARHPAAADRVLAQAPPPRERNFSVADFAFYEEKIAPILVGHCLECHATGPKKAKANLHLDTREGLLAGGDSGPVITPEAPDRSLLLRALLHDNVEPMPPKKALPASVIADFRKWIELAAPMTPKPLSAAPRP